MKFLFLIVLSVFIFPVGAVILDWSGSYELEAGWLQDVSGEHRNSLYHQLHLQPDIKVFDGVKVQSWFYLLSSADNSNNRFVSQDGPAFSWLSDNPENFSPRLVVRDLFLEVSKNFVVLQVGWKPHQFGLEMVYNDSSDPFTPVYNKQGSRGFISLKGFFESYYLKPMVHYLSDSSISIFVQGGLLKQQYGIEGIYASKPLLGSDLNLAALEQRWPSYLGLYAFYKQDSVNVEWELGYHSKTFGSTVKFDWFSPWKVLGSDLTFGLNLGLSLPKTAIDSTESTFYFDPAFSASIFNFVAFYEEEFKESQQYLEEYMTYSFHNGFYFTPIVSLGVLDCLHINLLVSTLFSIENSNIAFKFFESNLQIVYEALAGLEWSTTVGLVYPDDRKLYVGFNSGVVVSF